MNMRTALKQFEKLTIDNSPAILTTVGVVGTLATAILTGKATFKAAEILAEENSADPKDKVRLVWKEYVPAAGVGVIAVVSIVGANRIGSRRAAAIATAYAVSEKAFSEYKNKVLDKVGENKEREIRAEVAQDRVNRTPGSREVIISGTDVLCYETFTGRYFQSDMETLRKAQNDINAKILNDTYASLTEFYDRIGLESTTYSEEVGWNVDNLMELHFSTIMSEDNRPCICIDYTVMPVRKYYKLT